ncbi:similar to Saccharomyces cerevisiae YBL060W YEL1 Guanine nucleotide exchange factor specific for Arf3p [Maudiozyma saulgeensis]|uniref:Guanine-nucleotide exchange factor YEL1 n=1 Tax=Maudiozyma saulgeensis TaxID=1789683 RepID=A0A1X7R4M0_9SACH|nr:similar to Saccharomyces cerevisiae YBL060W YEL1 Guanine nucleotide exchange factor specific for Arf3p [Kazachstania saulgeensis]
MPVATNHEHDRPASILVPSRRAPPSFSQSLDPLHPSTKLQYNNYLSRDTIISNKNDISRNSTLNSMDTMEVVALNNSGSNHTSGNNSRTKLDNETYEIALSIYQNKFKKVSFKGYADYLGQKEHYRILCEYIQLLKPLPLSLASVLIHFSNKIYFIAEAQNIDRILEQISKEWIAEYPDTLWETNYEIVHIILFSILILNSDLHNEHIIRGKKDKFSAQTFIANTWYAIEKEVKTNYQEIDLVSIKQQADILFKEYYDILKNNPLPLFKGPRRSFSNSRRNSLNLSRRNSMRSMSHVKKMSSAMSDCDDHNSQTSLRTRSQSVNISNALSRSNSISSKKTMNSTFSKGTASWKYKHNQPLPQLYIKQSFDENMNRMNNTMWLMDSIIKINEKNLNKMTSKRNNNNRNQESNGNNNNSLNIKTDSVNLATTSSSSSSSAVSAVSSSVKSHSKGIFNWLRRSKGKTMYQESGKSMTYLDSSTRWTNARIRISEGRIFIFKTNNGNNASSKSQNSNKTRHVSTGTAQNSAKTPLPQQQKSASSSSSNNRLFSSGSTLSLPLTSSKGSHTSNESKDSVQNINCVVLNLFECTASVVQENIITGNQSKKANFTLTFPKNLNGVQTTLDFETPNFQLAHDFVECLNFWSGRLSPVPVEQFEIVSNEEYGWSSRILNDEHTTSQSLNNAHLCEWKPLLTMELFYDHMDEIPGKLPLQQKIEELKIFTDRLSKLIDEHNDLKPKIISIWDRSVNFDKVMDNWNAKYLFLNSQYNKRVIYLAALEESLEILQERDLEME